VTLVARHAALTDIGLHRSTNEDAFIAEPPLFAVADGMGGARAGEVASHLALETLVEALAAAAVLHDAAQAANERVYQLSRADRAHAGMGTTLTAVVLRDDRLEFAHVGDSRLYLWRDATLEQVTDDHSLVGEMLREGHLTREAALSHPQRSILSRALGTEPHVEVDEGALEVRAGDTVLLCSDGLYSMVPETTIAAVLAAVDDPVRIARQLVREAKNEGGHDNITVVVLRFDEAVAGATEAADGEAATGVLPVVDEAETSLLPVVDEAATSPPPAAGDDASGAPSVADADRALDMPSAAAAAAAADAADAADADFADADFADADADFADADFADADADFAAAADAADAALAPVGPARPGAPGTVLPAITAASPRRRRRRLWVIIAVSVLLLACVAASAAGNSVYFVGDHDGMVSVYHGLPWQVRGLRLYGLYLETTTPLAVVTPSLRARVERHDLHRKPAALALARQAQGLP
jgi:serine/threonine protein phosphatase PrpC